MLKMCVSSENSQVRISDFHIFFNSSSFPKESNEENIFEILEKDRPPVPIQ